MLSVSNPVLRVHLGRLRTCWIELSLQREHDFALLQELQFGHLLGHLLDPCPLPFRHQTHLRGSLGRRVPAEASFVSLDALWHPRGITARPQVTFCASLGPICCPWGFFVVTVWHPFARFRHGFIAHSQGIIFGDYFCLPYGDPIQ